MQTAVLARIAANLSAVAQRFLIDDSDQLFSPSELAMMGRGAVYLEPEPRKLTASAERRLMRYELPRALAELDAALGDAEQAVE